MHRTLCRGFPDAFCSLVINCLTLRTGTGTTVQQGFCVSHIRLQNTNPHAYHISLTQYKSLVSINSHKILAFSSGCIGCFKLRTGRAFTRERPCNIDWRTFRRMGAKTPAGTAPASDSRASHAFVTSVMPTRQGADLQTIHQGMTWSGKAVLKWVVKSR